MSDELRAALEELREYCREHRMSPSPEVYEQVIYQLDSILEDYE